MKTILNHIERIREQPHQVRKQVAFATAAALTACVALIWLVGSLATGAFAIKGSSFAAGAEEGNATLTDGAESQLAGAGAAAALPQSKSAPAHIEIIDSSPSPEKRQAEQTTIPF